MAGGVMGAVPAAPGIAAGGARVLLPPELSAGGPLPPERRAAELARAQRALEAAAVELDAIAARLRSEGRSAEADVVETGVLMVTDPGLKKEGEAAVRDRGHPAPAAILKASGAHAAAIAELDDPLLAARAADVRSLGSRAARLAVDARGSQGSVRADGPAVLVASDLGPADVAELGPEVVALALAEGAVRAHAAIVARSLGIPMVVAAGRIRTELAFLDADAWPTRAEHRAALEPILAPLRGRLTTVRVLDFGGDKTPPFLAGTRARGTELLLAEPERLEDQLAGILAAAAGRELELRVLLPMVRSPADVVAVRAALERVRSGDGVPPALGAMIETPGAAAAAARIADEADFLSIGTNDLAAAVMGHERFTSTESPAYHPSVLRAIEAVAAAAVDAHIPLEVCGEAASDPITVPLLVGLGVDE